jgi:hypothetical protein
MNILSVDWDYWFPNSLDFDWGHRESMFFIEPIWSIRAGNRGITSGKRAIDVMVPRRSFKTFWDQFEDLSVVNLVVAESHLSLLAWLREVAAKNVKIWNYDAHHDLGYGMQEENCGNWALKAFQEGILDDYRLVYPQWRVTDPENEKGIPVPDDLPFEYYFEQPQINEKIDVVFICRSGSWTPSWRDSSWMRFIGHFKNAYPWVWQRMQYAELALKRRKPNLKQAEELFKQQEEIRMQLMPNTP